MTADLAPFLRRRPRGEIELFLATQLVDEARHAAFFDRFGAEVMCLSADDFRGRMREVEQILLSPWREVFDDGLRDVAEAHQGEAGRPRPVRGGDRRPTTWSSRASWPSRARR